LQAKIYGPLILAAFFLFSSCKDPAKLGKDLQPNDHPVDVFFTDTVQAKTSALLIDTNISSYNSGYIFAGVYQDPVFGIVSSEAYTQFKFRTENVNTQGAICDSVVMQLAYGFYYFDLFSASSGNLKNIPPFEVYTLPVPLPDNFQGKDVSLLSSGSPVQIDIGSVNFDAYPELGNANSYMKVYLKTSFGQSILDTNGTGISNSALLTYYNGIGIKSSTPGSPSALLAFNLYNTVPQSKITIYHHTVIAPGDTAWSTSVLEFNGTCKSASKYDFDRNSAVSPLSPVNLPGTSPPDLNQMAYIQGGSGIMTKITFPGLEEIKKRGNILINKAELFIPVEDIYVEKYHPPRLVLYQEGSNQILKDTATQADLFVQQDGLNALANTTPVIAPYLPAKKGYIFPITTYLQACMLGKKNFDLILSASPAGVIFGIDQTFSPVRSPAWNSFPTYRVVGGSNSQPVKLKIYYTVAK
jgi:hypothetical protein